MVKNTEHEFCPYTLLRQNYKTDQDQFLVFSDGSSVTSHHMSRCLKMIIKKAGFNPHLYGTHSLRAGQTCDLFRLGLSVETIKKLGCWKSNAVYCYLWNYC